MKRRSFIQVLLSLPALVCLPVKANSRNLVEIINGAAVESTVLKIEQPIKESLDNITPVNTALQRKLLRTAREKMIYSS